ncbi:cache domain-containing protein, partial [Desulfovibrio piger]
MPSTREYRRIFRRLFVTHLGLALLPLVALGIFSIDRINSIYDEKISAGIEAVCSSKHRALDTFLHERVSQIKTLAFTHGLAELRDPDRLSRIFTVMQQSGRSFVDLGIIGMDGRHISYVGPFDLRDANYVSAPWFTEVLRKGVFVSDVFMGFRNVPHFIIAVLRHEGGESFIMRATIDMEAINSLLQRVYSGERSDAFLINEQGVLQTDSRDYGRIMEQFNVTLPNVLRQGIALVPLPSQPGDSGSKEPLAAMMHLDSMPWLLVVVDDVRESLAPLHRLRIYILLFVGLGAVLVTVGAFLGTRY